jgi:hypothetical protein
MAVFWGVIATQILVFLIWCMYLCVRDVLLKKKDGSKPHQEAAEHGNDVQDDEERVRIALFPMPEA